MPILKKRPVIKTEDDFINRNHESVIENDTFQSHNDKQTDHIDDKTTIPIKNQDAMLTDKAKEKLNNESAETESLKRVTTYIKDHLNKKIKLLSVLTDQKEYQLWNEALEDLLEKYKERGL